VNEDHERRPSEATRNYWIFAERKQGAYPDPTPRSGKWLVFVSPERVDEMWLLIQAATEEGRLGHTAKVATAKPSPLASGTGQDRVICIYTYDSDDQADVMRVREELRRLGISRPISYKTDEATREGRYSRRGQRVSKYRV
jgi:Domain of unknown function (DUF1917)